MHMWFCSDCFSYGVPFCMNRGHQLEPYHGLSSSKCREALVPLVERGCDAIDCGKKIEGLYFREFTTMDFKRPLAYLKLQTAAYAMMTTLICVCNAQWVAMYVGM
jgi:hypothetical protein